MSRYAKAVRLLPLFALSIGLGGCASQKHAVAMISSAQKTAEAFAQDVPEADPAKGTPAISQEDGLYFGQALVRHHRGDPLPGRFDRFMVSEKGEVDIRGFAALITKSTEIPVALNIAKTAAAVAAPAPQALGVLGMQANTMGAQRGVTMPVLWDGPLAGLLDQAAARFGVDWEYRNGVLQMADERTETFVMHALPTTTNLDTHLSTQTGGSSGSGSSGSSGGSGGSTENQVSAASAMQSGQKAAVDVWGEVKAALTVIIGDRGRFAVTPANGTITVTGSPAVIQQVAEYVHAQNAILERQVFVRVRVYSVNLGEGDDSALQFNSSFKTAARNLGLSWGSPGNAPTSAVGTFAATVLSTTSPWAGSDIVAKALSSVTNTSLISELNLTALNNRPVSKQDVRTESYVAQTAVTNGQYTSTTELVPGTLSTGFSITLLPRIISENRILMGYSINLSSLVALDKETNGQTFVQLPTVDVSGGLQEAMLRSGQVLMLMGYMADSAADARQGTGTPGNFLFGGTRSSTTAKKRIIVTMEPVITSESGQ